MSVLVDQPVTRDVLALLGYVVRCLAYAYAARNAKTCSKIANSNVIILPVFYPQVVLIFFILNILISVQSGDHRCLPFCDVMILPFFSGLIWKTETVNWCWIRRTIDCSLWYWDVMAWVNSWLMRYMWVSLNNVCRFCNILLFCVILLGKKQTHSW